MKTFEKPLPKLAFLTAIANLGADSLACEPSVGDMALTDTASVQNDILPMMDSCKPWQYSTQGLESLLHAHSHGGKHVDSVSRFKLVSHVDGDELSLDVKTRNLEDIVTLDDFAAAVEGDTINTHTILHGGADRQCLHVTSTYDTKHRTGSSTAVLGAYFRGRCLPIDRDEWTGSYPECGLIMDEYHDLAMEAIQLTERED